LIKKFYGTSEKCGEDPDMDRRIGLRIGCHRPQAAEAGRFTPHIDADVFGDSIRKGFGRIRDFPIVRRFRLCDRHKKLYCLVIDLTEVKYANNNTPLLAANLLAKFGDQLECQL
jgi:hypothetical protein